MNYLNTKSIVLYFLFSTMFVASAHSQENIQKQEQNWGLTTGGLPIATQAQESAKNQEKNWGLTLGGLLIATPEFTGSNEYDLLGVLVVNGYFALSEQSTLFVNNSVMGLNYQLSNVFSIGVIGNSRQEEDRSDRKQFDSFSDIDDAFEVGSYLSYQVNNELVIGVNALFDTSDTYDGWVANLNASYVYLVPDLPVVITTMVGLNYGSTEYNDTYYGVKPSSTSVLPKSTDTLENGFNSVDFGATIIYASSEKISIIGSIFATQYIGDAKDSAIIKEDTFMTVGLGVLYTF
jgi:outer membrane protein